MQTATKPNPSAKRRAKEEKKLRIANPKQTIKRLLRYVLDFKLLFGFGMLLVLGKALGNVGGNALLKPIINSLIAGESIYHSLKYLALMALLFLSAAGSDWLSDRFFCYVSENIVKRLRSELFSRCLKLPLRYFDAHKHGELMSRYTNDVDNIHAMLQESLIILIASVISFGATLAVMIYMSPILSLVVVLSLALMLLILQLISRQSARFFRKRQAALGDLNGYIEEMMMGQKLVQLFNREAESLADFAQRNEHLRQTSTAANTLATMLWPLIGNLSFIQFALVAIVGSLLAIKGGYGIDVGTLAAYLQFMRNLAAPLVNISQQINQIISAVAGAERVFAILDEEPEVDEGAVTLELVDGQKFWRVPAGSSVLPSAQSAQLGSASQTNCAATGAPAVLVPVKGEIEVAELCFGYEPGQEVLRSLSFTLSQGEKLAFVGSTGAGKTTITNLLNRFYEVNQGAIYLDGIDIRQIRKADLRQQMGLVLQDVALFKGSILSNIRYGRLEAAESELIAAAQLANAEDFILQLPQGYATCLQEDGNNLSQGQRQLLSIARAAVHDPLLLVLDEATSSVDTRTEKLIAQGMDKLMEGRSTLVIAHRLSTVRNADKILIIEGGQIIEQGDHLSLMAAQGRYYALNMGVAELV